MNNLPDFGQFINENSKEELDAIRYMMSVGLLKNPVEEIRAALAEGGDHDLWGYGPVVEEISDSAIRLHFSFDPDYHFPDLDDDLALGLGLKAEVKLSPNIELVVELDMLTGALTWRIGVSDDALKFNKVKEVRSKPDEQYSIFSPDQVEDLLTAIESFIGDGPIVDGRHQTEIYSIIIEVYAKETKRLRRRAPGVSKK